jgi:hypothetical protein
MCGNVRCLCGLRLIHADKHSDRFATSHLEIPSTTSLKLKSVYDERKELFSTPVLPSASSWKDPTRTRMPERFPFRRIASQFRSADVMLLTSPLSTSPVRPFFDIFCGIEPNFALIQVWLRRGWIWRLLRTLWSHTSSGQAALFSLRLLAKVRIKRTFELVQVLIFVKSS